MLGIVSSAKQQKAVNEHSLETRNTCIDKHVLEKRHLQRKERYKMNGIINIANMIQNMAS